MFSKTEAYFAADSLAVKIDQGRSVKATECKIQLINGTVVTLAGYVRFLPHEGQQKQIGPGIFYDSEKTAEEAIADGKLSLTDQIKAFQGLLQPKLEMALNSVKDNDPQRFVSMVRVPVQPFVDAIFAKMGEDGQLKMFQLNFVPNGKGTLEKINCDGKVGALRNCVDLVTLITSSGGHYLLRQSGQFPPEVFEHFHSIYKSPAAVVWKLINWEIATYPNDYASPISTLHLARGISQLEPNAVLR